MAMNAAQSRAARGLLGWSQTDLALEASLSAVTVKRFETGRGANVSASAIESMQTALERGGVHFIPENGGGAGVRLLKAQG